MLKNKDECYFNKNGYCVHTDKICKKLCNAAMKEYDEMDFRDHFDTFWKRKERRIDLATKWLAIGLSIIALFISFLGYKASKETKPVNENRYSQDLNKSKKKDSSTNYSQKLSTIEVVNEISPNQANTADAKSRAAD